MSAPSTPVPTAPSASTAVASSSRPDPICKPASRDAALSAWLDAHLRANIQYDSPEAAARRQSVIHSITTILTDWVTAVLHTQSVPPDILQAARPHVHIAGSIQVDVHQPESDIDLLTVLPANVSRSRHVFGVHEEWHDDHEAYHEPHIDASRHDYNVTHPPPPQHIASLPTTDSLTPAASAGAIIPVVTTDLVPSHATATSPASAPTDIIPATSSATEDLERPVAYPTATKACLSPKPVQAPVLADIFRAHAGTKSVLCIPDTTIPLLKLEFEGYTIDLTFAEHWHAVISPSWDIHSDMALEDFDDVSEICTRGLRANEGIVRIVPDVVTFRSALRVIRLWARRRRIYSHTVGFLGGISWAVLVARICQLFPDMGPAELVVRFFRTFSEWAWGAFGSPSRPVLLREDICIDEGIMPIVTPTFPEIDTAFHVSISTLSIMRSELRRGCEIVDGSYVNGDEDNERKEMDKVVDADSADLNTMTKRFELLFEPYVIFDHFKLFLRVDAIAGHADNMRVWESWVTTRIRLLLEKLAEYCWASRPCPVEDGVDGDVHSERMDGALIRSHFIGVRNLGGSDYGVDKLKEMVDEPVRAWRKYVMGMYGAEEDMDVYVELVTASDVRGK